MLTCKDFLQELNDYLDETVDQALKDRLEQHITQCPNCWVICDTTKKTLKVFKGCQPQVIPEAVRERLMLALQKKMEAERQT